MESGQNSQQLEEALMDLIHYKAKRVDRLQRKISTYKSKLEVAQKQLNDSRSELSLLRTTSSQPLSVIVACPAPTRFSPFIPPLACRPSSTTPLRLPQKRSYSPVRCLRIYSGDEREYVRRHYKDTVKQKGKSRDLISTVCSRDSPMEATFQSPVLFPSKHTRRLRSIAINPLKERMFVTSSLDGALNLWELQRQSCSATLLHTRSCLTPWLRRWPEDVTWHPDGDRIFAVYMTEDNGPQVSIVNLSCDQEVHPFFLDEKPHKKGAINSIVFMPWEGFCFATGGSDHAVVVWSEKNGSYATKHVHTAEHSSAVTGVAGLFQKKIIASVGLDKRLIYYDVPAGSLIFKCQLDGKCLTILPNPRDFNLIMVQTGIHGKQLRLFDIRTSTEIHTFGYQPEGSKSHSNLIKPAWSPDGLCASSGSADPKIHIFDIRYNGATPSQTIQAHCKRVLKAEWFSSCPLLVSISSDLQIGLHNIM